MPQFRPQPNLGDNEGSKQPGKNLDEKKQEDMPAPPTRATGPVPILLLSGPYPAPDADLLAATIHTPPQTVRMATPKATGDTGRFVVIPAEERRKYTSTNSAHMESIHRKPKEAHPRKTVTIWVNLVLFGLELALLFFAHTALFPGFSFTTANHRNDVMCGNNCQPPDVNVPSHPGSSTSSIDLPPAGGPVPTPPPAISQVPAIDSSWKLTFDDEFNGTEINWNTWEDGGQNWGSGGGGEEQAYLASECSVSDGVLRLRADNTSAQGKSYSSCMLDTMDTFQQTYGYFECRAKIPQGQGFWPAFWLYNEQHTIYEIDVMENLGNDSSMYYMTYHSPSGDPQKAYHGMNLATNYHTYAVKWTPNAITYYLDNTPLFTVTDNIYHGPMFIFVNFAVGGDWPGSPDQSTVFPGYFDVDYIRAYSMP